MISSIKNHSFDIQQDTRWREGSCYACTYLRLEYLSIGLITYMREVE